MKNSYGFLPKKSYLNVENDGWKNIKLIVSSYKLSGEGSKLDKRIEQNNKVSPKKKYKRTPRKIAFFRKKMNNLTELILF